MKTSETSSGRQPYAQIRLSTILLAMAVLCVGLAWAAHRVERNRQLQCTIDRVVSEQGAIEYRFPPRKTWIGAVWGDLDRSVRLARVPPTVSLKDIAAFSNLEVLDIHHVKSTEVSLLSDMKQLRELRLDGGCLKSLAQLGSMPKLVELAIEHNAEFRDCRSLVQFSGLKRLSLMRTGVEDVSPLKDLRDLRSLDLSSTQISTLNPLASFSGLLVNLHLGGTAVCDDDLAALANFHTLRLVDLRWCRNVTDLSPLRHLPAVFVLVDDPDRLRVPPELIGRVDTDVPGSTYD